MKKIIAATIKVNWGYETHCLEVSRRQWDAIRKGKTMAIAGPGYGYEGRHYDDTWFFNDEYDGSLLVVYGDDGGVGWQGNLSGADVTIHEPSDGQGTKPISLPPKGGSVTSDDLAAPAKAESDKGPTAEPDVWGDPWLRSPESRKSFPDGDLLFACAYGLNLGPTSVGEAAFLHRSDTRDELWVVAYERLDCVPEIANEQVVPRDLKRPGIYHSGCAIAEPRKGAVRPACLRLLDCLIRARLGYATVDGLTVAGMVEAEGFEGIKKKLKQEQIAIAAREQLKTSNIVATAKRLGLRPEAVGLNSWSADCPETHHWLCISTGTETFGCGYCKVKGGAEELKAFVKERKAWAKKNR